MMQQRSSTPHELHVEQHRVVLYMHRRATNSLPRRRLSRVTCTNYKSSITADTHSVSPEVSQFDSELLVKKTTRAHYKDILQGGKIARALRYRDD